MNDDERALLKSAITHGAEAPVASIERLGNHRTFYIMGAAMAEALERKFAETTAPDEVKAYVKDLFERFPSAGGDIKPSTIEAVIRGSLGEPGLVEPLTYDDLLGAAYLLTYAIMSYENLDSDGTEQYFQKVIAMADEAAG